MTFVVSFDGSDLSFAALDRACEWATHVGAEVVALTVVPGDAPYARDQGWIEEPSEFDAESVIDDLRERARAAHPDVTFHPVRVEAFAGRETVGRTIRKEARNLGAEVVFIGSDNAGRVVSPVSSVGDKVAGGTGYDLYIVRSESE